jgi:hypothetical protein
MTGEDMQESALPAAVAERMEQLLNEWGRLRRLDASTVATIRQAVLAQSVELPAAWWPEQRERINTLVMQTRRLAHELASAGLAQANAWQSSRWRANQWANTAWSQGYVRLG